jgi:hypothetical protein
MVRSDLQLDGMDKAWYTNNCFKDTLVKRTSNRVLGGLIENKTLGRLSNRIIDWSGDLKMDHIIPVGITYGIPELQEMLKGIGNLRLIHGECHKLKTFGDEKDFFKLFRKHKKSLISEGVGVKEATLKTILKLHLEGLFDWIETDRKQAIVNRFIKKVNYLNKNIKV